VQTSDFFIISNTDEGVTVVCDSKILVNSLKTESGWSCFKVMGMLFIKSVGILAGVASVLAEANISIFAFCTYDTSFILVRTPDLEKAIAALKSANYQVV
jgi:hypothetical protein